jgi:erythrocyte band 7 integral membrane protein
MQSPTALQLRYLQTLTTIASEKNSTIVFPIPVMKMLPGLDVASYLETQL